MAHISDSGLGVQDKRVVEAFCERRALNGYKLTTDGQRLDGYWMGGRGIAEWRGGAIHMDDPASRSTQTVQRAVLRCMKTGSAKRGRRR